MVRSDSIESCESAFTGVAIVTITANVVVDDPNAFSMFLE
jgi:hypothetical protein